MKNFSRLFGIPLAVLFLTTSASPGAGEARGGVEGRSEGDRLQWWREARFGLFIHWGPVSLKGTEIGWSRGGERRGYGSKGDQVTVEVYDNLYKEFNPTNFNAREWWRWRRPRDEVSGVHEPASRRFQHVRHEASDYKITSR
jgi:hypothetical protein